MAHRRQLLAVGLTPKMIRTRVAKGVLTRIHPNVYATAAAPLSWIARLLAAQLWLGDDATVSHRSAAALHGLDGFETDLVELTVPINHTTQSRRGARVHHSSNIGGADRRRMDLHRVTIIERTLTDLSAVIRPRKVEEALENALFQGLTTHRRLAGYVADMPRPGTPNIRVLDKLLSDRDPDDAPAESIFETRFYRRIKDSPIAPPEWQYSVFDSTGYVGRLDAAYPELRIGLEAHSLRHHSARERMKEDARRHNRFTALGWRVHYVTYEDLMARPEEVITAIRALINTSRTTPNASLQKSAP